MKIQWSEVGGKKNASFFSLSFVYGVWLAHNGKDPEIWDDCENGPFYWICLQIHLKAYSKSIYKEWFGR